MCINVKIPDVLWTKAPAASHLKPTQTDLEAL